MPTRTKLTNPKTGKSVIIRRRSTPDVPKSKPSIRIKNPYGRFA